MTTSCLKPSFIDIQHSVGDENMLTLLKSYNLCTLGILLCVTLTPILCSFIAAPSVIEQLLKELETRVGKLERKFTEKLLENQVRGRGLFVEKLYLNECKLSNLI